MVNLKLNNIINLLTFGPVVSLIGGYLYSYFYFRALGAEWVMKVLTYQNYISNSVPVFLVLSVMWILSLLAYKNLTWNGFLINICTLLVVNIVIYVIGEAEFWIVTILFFGGVVFYMIFYFHAFANKVTDDYEYNFRVYLFMLMPVLCLVIVIIATMGAIKDFHPNTTSFKIVTYEDSKNAKQAAYFVTSIHSNSDNLALLYNPISNTFFFNETKKLQFSKNKFKYKSIYKFLNK